MSSNINIVDKLNPLSFETAKDLADIHNKKLISIYENDIEKKKVPFPLTEENKITILLSKAELDLTDLQKIHEKCINDIEVMQKKNKTKTNDKNNTDKTDAENELKKKLLLIIYTATYFKFF